MPWPRQMQEDPACCSKSISSSGKRSTYSGGALNCGALCHSRVRSRVASRWDMKALPLPQVGRLSGSDCDVAHPLAFGGAVEPVHLLSSACHDGWSRVWNGLCGDATWQWWQRSRKLEILVVRVPYRFQWCATRDQKVNTLCAVKPVHVA